MQVLCGIFLAQTFKMNKAVPLWHRDSFVLSNSLCQSLEFSFAEFQDRKPFFPKALFRFGNGTALSYPIPCAKALNSALPNSRIESRFSPKLCSALVRNSLVLSIALCQSLEFSLTEFQDRKPFFPKALCRFGNGTALFYPLPYAKACKGRFFLLYPGKNPRQNGRFPKPCSALAPVQPWFFFQTQAPVKSQAHKAGVKKAPC